MKNQALRLILLVSVYVIANPALAKNNTIDSLQQIIRLAPDDTNKVIAYRMLCGALVNSNPRSAIPYGWDGAELGKQLHWDKGVAGCYLNLGNAYTNLAVYDTALMVTDSALAYAMLAGDPSRIALIYINRAAIHIEMNSLDKAMEDALKALPYAEASKNNDRIARVYMTLGNISYYQEKWNKAIEYYTKCLPLFEQSGAGNMAGICNMNIATSYKNMTQPDTAVYYIRNAITVFEKAQDIKRLIQAYAAGASIYLELKNYPQSGRFALAAIRLAEQDGDREQVILNKHALGKVYFMQENYEQALEILLPALDESQKQLFYKGIADISKTLSELYHDDGEDDEAYEYLLQFIAASDTLEKRKQNDQLMSLKKRFEIEQNEKENRLRNSDKALQQAQATRKNLRIYLLAAGSFSLIVILYLLCNRSRLNNKLKEARLRNKIISDLHEDIGATLSGVKMYSELAAGQVTASNPKTFPLLKKISGMATEMTDTMSDVMWMIKPGNNHFSHVDDRMTHFAYAVCSAKNIELHLNKDEKLDAMILPALVRRDIYLVFKEAVNNAVKHSGCNLIEINIYGEKGRFYLKVQDNGNGFDPQKITRTRGIDQMKLRMEQHKGSFEIITADKKGTTISISVPIP